MLLQNRSRIIYKVLIDLVFDDESNKNLVVGIDDVVRIIYRRNGEMRKGIGKITDIIPIVISGSRRVNEDCYCHTNNNDNAKLLIDFGDKYRSNKKYIKLDDIIDISVIEEEEYTCEDLSFEDIEDVFRHPFGGDYHRPTPPRPSRPPHKPDRPCDDDYDCGYDDFDDDRDLSKEDIDDLFRPSRK